MQLRSIALAALAALAAAAHAAPVNLNDPSLLRINLAGASALRNTFASLATNDLCGGTASNSDIRLYNTNGSNSFNGNFWAVTCPLPAAGAAKLGVPTGTPFALFKSDAGGSAQGVFTLGNQRPFMDPACAPGNCNNAPVAATVHAGVSDVEPKLFRDINVPDDSADPDVPGYPLSGPDTTGMTITPVVQTIFAVAVNQRLYEAMFAQQGLGSRRDAAGALCTVASTEEVCIPSIGYAEARSYFQGTESSWRLLSNDASLVNSQVNVCRRVQGSGTQAAANAHLGGFPCTELPTTVARWFDSSSAAPRESSPFLNTMADGTSFAAHLAENIPTVVTPATGGGLFVFEGPGTGNVTSCLIQAQTAGGYAIGHVSKENAQTATWKHVKLEGANPLRDNLKRGRYDYAVESTMQYKAADLSGNLAIAVPRLVAEAARPDALARLSSNAQQGVAALPSAYAGAFGAGSANEITFGSRVTRVGNTCNPFTAVK